MLDLEEEGGVLSVSWQYTALSFETQKKELQSKFPEYTLKQVGAKAIHSTVKFEIEQVGISEEIPVKQSQLGPYINVSLDLTKEQMKKLRLHKDSLTMDIGFKLPIHSTYLDENGSEVGKDLELVPAIVLDFE